MAKGKWSLAADNKNFTRETEEQKKETKLENGTKQTSTINSTIEKFEVVSINENELVLNETELIIKDKKNDQFPGAIFYFKRK